MPKANTATLYLDNAIAEVVANKKLYVNNPDKDFTRERKLPMEDLIYSILEMKGGSLTGEMINICEKLNTPLTKSAFVQQRDKLKSEFGAIACDMESAAAAYVCHITDTPFAAVRRISDDAGEEATESYRSMNELAESCLLDIVLKGISRISSVDFQR